MQKERIVIKGDPFSEGIPPKELFCVAGIFYFVNSRRGPFAGRNVSWRDYRFLAENSRISIFQLAHRRDHGSVNWASYEVPSWIADLGLF